MLVRHGRSAHVHGGGWVDNRGLATWRAAYEAAGLAGDEGPPQDLAHLAAAAGLVVASDAPRAVESARLLAPGRDVVLTALLRELDLHGPELGGLSLPLPAWALAIGARAFALGLRRRYPSAEERGRIDAAARWLDDLAARRRLVVAVTHASFRRRLFLRLRRDGWRADPGRRTLRHWSAWSLARRETERLGRP